MRAAALLVALTVLSASTFEETVDPFVARAELVDTFVYPRWVGWCEIELAEDDSFCWSSGGDIVGFEDMRTGRWSLDPVGMTVQLTPDRDKEGTFVPLPGSMGIERWEGDTLLVHPGLTSRRCLLARSRDRHLHAPRQGTRVALTAATTRCCRA